MAKIFACGSKCPKGIRSGPSLLRVLLVGPHVPDSKMARGVAFGPTCTTPSRIGLLCLRLLHVGPKSPKAGRSGPSLLRVLQVGPHEPVVVEQSICTDHVTVCL